MDTKEMLTAWAASMETFTLPDWDTLPQLELYMDQVIVLLEQYLPPASRADGGKGVTASTINNYVRMKVMPPPVKKKYGRTHLAYLIMICVLKQTLSIASIRLLLPTEQNSEQMEPLYRRFVCEHRAVSERYSQHIRAVAANTDSTPALSAAILSHLSTALTEHLLADRGEK